MFDDFVFNKKGPDLAIFAKGLYNVWFWKVNLKVLSVKKKSVEQLLSSSEGLILRTLKGRASYCCKTYHKRAD